MSKLLQKQETETSRHICPRSSTKYVTKVNLRSFKSKFNFVWRRKIKMLLARRQGGEKQKGDKNKQNIKYENSEIMHL